MPAKLLMSNAQVAIDEEGWLALRRGGITASEMAAVVGLAPPSWGSAFDLYHAKLGGWVNEPSEAMERGHYMEPWVASRFERAHPELSLRDGGLYCNADRQWQMATFDRLAYENEAPDLADPDLSACLGPVQIKTAAFLDPADGWGEPGTSSIPVHYRVQVLMEMDTGDFDTAWLPVDDGRKVVTYVLHRDEAAEKDIAYLREAALEFLDRLSTGREPEVDWTPATQKALKRLHPELEDREVAIPLTLARRYKKAIAAEKRAKERKQLCVNQILHRMAGAKYATVSGLSGKGGAPVKLATRSVYEQAEYTVPAHPVDKLQPGRWTP